MERAAAIGWASLTGMAVIAAVLLAGCPPTSNTPTQYVTPTGTDLKTSGNWTVFGSGIDFLLLKTGDRWYVAVASGSYDSAQATFDGTDFHLTYTASSSAGEVTRVYDGTLETPILIEGTDSISVASASVLTEHFLAYQVDPATSS